MNAMTETKPMFEVGKTYRTRGNHEIRITSGGDKTLVGWQVNCANCERHRMMYDINGVAEGTGWTMFDLRSGAIEDEKPEGRSTPYTNEERLDEAYRRIEAQTSVIAGMAAKIEAQSEAIDEIGKNAGGRLKIIEGFLRRYTFPEPLDMSTDPAPTEATCGHPECGQCYPKPAKRTIKGGWVNVYRGEFGRPAITAMHFSREDADSWDKGDHRNRIACIQIPDFTEGEGL